MYPQPDQPPPFPEARGMPLGGSTAALACPSSVLEAQAWPQDLFSQPPLPIRPQPEDLKAQKGPVDWSREGYLGNSDWNQKPERPGRLGEGVARGKKRRQGQGGA